MDTSFHPTQNGSARKGAAPVLLRIISFVRRFPLFYKVLIANGLIVAVGTAVGVWLTAVHVQQDARHAIHIELLLLLEMIGVPLTLLINFAILKMAFQPVRAMQRLAEQLEAGDVGARIVPPFFTDRETERLAAAINHALDQLQEYQERVRMLSRGNFASLEAEGRRISRELHDEIGQVLAAVLIKERILLNSLTTAKHQEEVEELLKATRQVLLAIQRICTGLRPPALEDLGLSEALQRYVQEFLPEDTVHTHFTISGNIGRLPADVELGLYRIAQAALTNVLRHAKASQIWLALGRLDGQIVLSIQDNGVGFVVGEMSQHPSLGHLGLLGMRERAALLGGEVSIQSTPGQGTRVQARIPLDANEPVGEARYDEPRSHPAG